MLICGEDCRTFITEKPLRVEELLAFVSSSDCGAQALFVGVVRNRNHGRAVKSVTYEAFQPLAEKLLAEIASEAASQWGARVAAAHRLGRLGVGEASVVAAAAAPHRAEAFAACRQVIEQIKLRLPVWKKEHYVDGEELWLDGRCLASSQFL